MFLLKSNYDCSVIDIYVFGCMCFCTSANSTKYSIYPFYAKNKNVEQ